MYKAAEPIKRGRAGRLTATLAPMVLLMAVCAAGPATADSGISETVAGSSDATTGDTTATTAADAPPATEGEPVQGGVLKTWNRLPAPTYDPVASATAHSLVYAGQIFSQLVRVDPTQERLDVIIGDLAEDWEVSEDGLQFTFHLREGVTWHDGTPLTADDVVFALDYMADPEASAIAQNFPTYESSEAVDETTVRVHLSSPQAAFLQMLAQGFSVIIPRHIVEAGVDPTSTDFLVGTGPFRFVSFDGSTFVVERNDDYFIEGRPYLDSIEISVIGDSQAQESAFISHQVNITQPWFGFDSFEAGEALAAATPDDVVVDHRTVGRVVLFTGKHEDGAPWNDPRVREAFNLVLDRTDLITAGSGHPEWGEAGGYLVPDSGWGVPPDEAQDLLNLDSPSEDDIARAQELMSEAGYADGFEISVLHRDLAYQTRVVSAMGSMLNEHLGVEVTSDIRDTAAFLEMRAAGQFDYLLDGFSLPTGDPDEALTLYTSDSSQNVGAFRNEAYDELVANQSAARNEDERVELVAEAERLLIDNLPALPIYWSDYGAAWWPEVNGFVMQPSLYTNVSLDTVWLTPES